mmetsp:Transcript_5441/g.18317  ORF Transcript_5441/g.18317 Transcript_5441/m.18317 type:complete len:793 (+) Transcript_5441:122-2500(+)
MGTKLGKRTKKFTKKHLDGELRRRKVAKVKRNRALGDARKRRARGDDDDSQDSGAEDEDEEVSGDDVEADGKKRLEDMSIDEFLNQSDYDDEDDEEEEGDGEDEDDASEEEGGSDSDEEDEEEPESESDEEDASESDEDVIKMNKETAGLKKAASSHKAELEKLKETDPEFYEFLKEEDEELLDFDDDDEEDDDLSDDEDGEDDDDDARKKKKKKKTRTITSEIVQKLCDNAEGGQSLGGAKALLQAYRAACHYGDDENDGDETSVRLASSSAFHELVQYTLSNGDDILRGLLGVDAETENQDATRGFKPHANARWKKVEPLAKSFIGNTLHLLGNLTDAEMTGMVLRRLNVSTPFMATFERLTKRVTRVALHCFGSGEPSVRVQSILLLRAMAVTLPPPALERIAKGVYRTFASNAKFVNADSVEHIAFMSTCVVEIFGLDHAQSYPLAFTYIRQLASLLRGALTAKSKEAFRNVYCWQYVNCLECWERVLSAHAKEESSALRPLVYPLAQVALGAARLLPSARYAPLRLRLVTLLNRLGASTGRFIPIAPLLMELLTFSELTKPPLSVKSHPPDFTLVLRLAKQDLRIPGVQDVIVESTMEALAEHLHQNAYSPAFPELAHIPTRELKKFTKTITVTRFRKAARAVIEAAERTSDWVIRKRDAVDFAPKDLAKVENFLREEKAENKAPISRLTKTLHEKAAQRVAAQQATEVTMTRNKKGSTGASDSEDDENVDDDDDDDDDDAVRPSRRRDNNPTLARASSSFAPPMTCASTPIAIAITHQSNHTPRTP